ncbi:MAG: tetratricopeptide repeat protein [Desulfobacterales bacterium]|nr:tetratricopeptide repeat protein [Desulfobacterales bacterium]
MSFYKTIDFIPVALCGGALVLVMLWGCASQIKGSSPTLPVAKPASAPTPTPAPALAPAPTSAPTPAPPREPVPPRPPPSPQAQASLQLTERGRLLLESGRPDDAISALEQAISLSPSNGRNYYYLAEAWLKKNNPAQAAEFNRLAGIYLQKEADWVRRVARQKERIAKLKK